MDPHDALVAEHLLLTRHALQGVPAHEGHDPLDRSATVLLARLRAQGPMSVGEVADAFGLDVSTVHRQVAAAMRAGLVERIDDPDGGAARKHRPTPEGERRLADELAARRSVARRVTTGWEPDELATFVRLLRRFNQDVESDRGQPWPRGV